jgi:hypothetical protein
LIHDGPGPDTIDTITYAIVVGKLENLGKQEGYLLEGSHNAAPFLLGKLFDLETSEDGSVTLTPIGDFNYLKSLDNMNAEFLDKSPDFDAYLKRGFKSTIGSKTAANLTAELKTDESMHVRYGTIYSAVVKGDFIDEAKYTRESRQFNFPANLTNPVMITEVTVKKLEYKKLKKFEGDFKADMPSIFNVSGSPYYENGTEANVIDVLVRTTNLMLAANGSVDTARTNTARPTGRIRIKTIKTLPRVH